ncbi:hypothetical protein EGK59_16360 [Acinetobacter soli]|nr:hypothetical protein EGK59_16360 [Acinetobacter soli]
MTPDQYMIQILTGFILFNKRVHNFSESRQSKILGVLDRPKIQIITMYDQNSNIIRALKNLTK